MLFYLNLRCQKGFVTSGVFFSMGNMSKWLFECLKLPTPDLEKTSSGLYQTIKIKMT